MRFTLTTLSFLVASAAAIGKAVVKNNSEGTIYVWSVGSEISEKVAVETGKSWSEALHTDEKTGGIAIKITTEDDGIFTGAAQQIFAYNLDGEKVWYDLSTVDGAPFEGTHVKVTNRRNPTIDWPEGTNPGGEFSQIKAGDAAKDVVLLVGAAEA
ncbi:hypothetical protein BU23DRAFT_133277 [Bimuria novae-zelandiae CBS 107.79]|uniref:BYS1 domain protein n=1 Tax=Bimuria novae-zelandiae CBS 107.79 TaxID=1447943 RepID=A0A6A5V9U6_9PLEO|nr:hypothetical protein BU23DRAFT_133277 [Bimuria novae-zelandiae CBS 107.79]